MGTVVVEHGASRAVEIFARELFSAGKLDVAICPCDEVAPGDFFLFFRHSKEGHHVNSCVDEDDSRAVTVVVDRDLDPPADSVVDGVNNRVLTQIIHRACCKDWWIGGSAVACPWATATKVIDPL